MTGQTKHSRPSWPSALGIWFLLLAAAFASATIREVFITPRIGEFAAKAIASVVFAFIIFGITLAVFPRLKCRSFLACLFVGILWTLMTLVFEFSMGVYRGMSWEAMLADYNVFAGRLWPLVLVSTLVSPVVAFRIKGSKE